MTQLQEHSPYFLPYQQEWLADTSRFKIWQKSRRIGATYVESYASVLAAIAQDGAVDTFFSTADITTAREFILYCLQWARVFNAVAQDLGEIAIDEDKGVLAHVLKFANGRRIMALSSNPANLRGKGGRVVLDEYAHHKNDEAMWQAAFPATTWGGDLIILSTHNGTSCRFFRMTEEAQSSDSIWSLHTTTIYDAVADGLADKILRRSLTAEERKNWISEQRRACGDELAWQQEYCCRPLDAATAWLPWDLISSAENNSAGDPAQYGGGLCYVGYDIAIRRDLAVIWVVEAVGDLLWTREVVALKESKFREQMDHLRRVMDTYRVSKLSIDQTGMGEAIVEQSQGLFGTTRVDGVLFTAAAKQELAIALKQKFEDRRLRIPASKAVRDDHHAVRRVTTASGNPRFDADRTQLGHADRFWAHALAVYGAAHGSGPLQFESSGDCRWTSSQRGLADFGLPRSLRQSSQIYL
ncbi:MAG: terminase family protein [Cyanobacteria bacterium P01_F01_bin.153]